MDHVTAKNGDRIAAQLSWDDLFTYLAPSLILLHCVHVMMGDSCGGPLSWHTRHKRSVKARSLFQRQALREAGDRSKRSWAVR